MLYSVVPSQFIAIQLASPITTEAVVAYAAWDDIDKTGKVVANGTESISITTAEAGTLIPSPTISINRSVKNISVYNPDSVTHTVSVLQATRPLAVIQVASGSTLYYESGKGWYVVKADGSAPSPITTLPDGNYTDVTISGSGTVVTINNDIVTNAKAANMATKTIKGRNTAGTGDPEDLTPDSAQAILDTATTPYIKLQSVIFNLDFSADTTAVISDATTYYIPGAQGVTMTATAANTYGVYIENDCTLYAASFWHVSTAVASSENGTLFIRKNNASNDNISTSVPTAGASAAIQRFTGLSINYSAGDFIYPGYTTPTYATNPTNLRIMVTLWFKLR